MICWKCKKSIEAKEKILFRATCPHCDIDLHVCVNCRFYAPGKPNDCSVPGTDFIRNREAANFCEEFRVKSSFDPPKNNPDKFNSLFKP